MSSARYAETCRELTDAQRDAIWECYMSGTNHDGHTWVTFTAVEELIVKLFDKPEGEEHTNG